MMIFRMTVMHMSTVKVLFSALNVPSGDTALTTALHLVRHDGRLGHKQNDVFIDGDDGVRLAFGAVRVGIHDLDGDIDGRLHAGAACAVGQAVDLERRDGADGRGAARADEGERICRVGGNGVGDVQNDALALPLLDAGVENALRLNAHLFVQSVYRIPVDGAGTFIRLEIGKK